jgi:hypothetical protein
MVDGAATRHAERPGQLSPKTISSLIPTPPSSSFTIKTASSFAARRESAQPTTNTRFKRSTWSDRQSRPTTGRTTIKELKTTTVLPDLAQFVPRFKAPARWRSRACQTGQWIDRAKLPTASKMPYCSRMVWSRPVGDATGRPPMTSEASSWCAVM